MIENMTTFYRSYNNPILNIIPSVVNAAIAAKVISKNTTGTYVFENAQGAETKIRGEAKIYDYLAANLDDLVCIGKKINPLWARDMEHLKERIEAKHPLQDSMFESMYDSETDGNLEMVAPSVEGGTQEGTVTLDSVEGDVSSDGLKIF